MLNHLRRPEALSSSHRLVAAIRQFIDAIAICVKQGRHIFVPSSSTECVMPFVGRDSDNNRVPTVLVCDGDFFSFRLHWSLR